MDESEEGFRVPDLEILSDTSDDENQEEVVEAGSVDHAGSIEIVETPPPTLTIGTVLDKLPKIKSGMANFVIVFFNKSGLFMHMNFIR